ncbi:MAG TPA: DEAD/DEAH box helicase [Smithellaceae bacterium]|jgi:ATP-dependent RNA helicase DeaD|nr:DEAD/DEAH box helicase [Smithellaceae bacterium]HNT91773.1 DEAD/DEAH box helicase [Smithellaceae bacterium]HNV64291.1 DEAD/DEAH box helicase [Smithellaceae bacterium]HNZ32051.1 DEAD/DEAH box helicase [Smithellaceae bacterium]HPM69534.1 DEAD/DEAH box helicase [Smithellaceae bacterium]
MEEESKNEAITAESRNGFAEISMKDLTARMREACVRAGWNFLTPVQAKAIPYLLADRDVMVQSRTGSGKTGAYLLPIIEKNDFKKNVTQALVLVPTRELALQVSREAQRLSEGADLRTAVVYGGVGYGTQLEAFRSGAHLVVGTPGRILDHLLKNNLSLDNLRILVFDEADRMLSMGFYPDMVKIRKYIPVHEILSSMFSATFPPQVIRLADQFMRAPQLLSLSGSQVHIAEIEHVYYVVPGMRKERSLVRIIEVENPVSAIIFCNTKDTVHYLSVVLKRFGYDADELSSDLAQSMREKVMARVRRGALRFLVATDVAARGIDIPDLSHVIQYEPPEDPEAYIHRAGRTGRMGSGGVAISLVAEMEKFKLQSIARYYNINMQERPLPGDEELEKVVAERVTALLEARLRARDNLQIERMRRFAPLAKSLAQTDDQLALITMLLDDYYQQSLHAPPAPPAEEAGLTTAKKKTKKRRVRDNDRSEKKE